MIMQVSQKFFLVLLSLVMLLFPTLPAFAGTVTLTPVSNELNAEFNVKQAGGGGGSGGSITVPPIAGPPECPFEDIAGHWAENEIKNMYGLGFVEGVSGYQFAPDGLITRAEFTAVIVRTLGLDTEGHAGQSDMFADVSQGSWYFRYVNTAVSAGIVEGLDNQKFGPDNPVTREQMAVIAIRALNYKNKGVTLTAEQVTELLAVFSDREEISLWARTGVAEGVKTAIIEGLPDGIFAPGAGATRAEGTVAVWRLYNLL